MFRTFLVIAAVTVAGLLTPATGADESKFKFGEPYKGEVSDTPKRGMGGFDHYWAEIPVTLKAGQDISITCTVVGKDRKLYVEFLDPKGSLIGSTKKETKTASLKVEEVNATGEYKILIYSPLTGPYTLRATTSAEEEVSVKAIEDEIKSLKLQLADAEARLKKAKAKK